MRKKRLSWDVYTNEYLIMMLIRQIRKKRVSRQLVEELMRRGILEGILETLKRDKEFYNEFKEAIEFVKNIVFSETIRETLGRKYRVPEVFAKFPEILKDWLRESYEEVIDTFEDEKFRYKLVFDGEYRIVLEWKL